MFLFLQLGDINVTMTALIILVTCIVSYAGENDPYFKERYLFSPYFINKRGEYYRFITGGFLHGGYVHLAFNMITFYSFGNACERVFQYTFNHEQLGSVVFVLFYLSAIVAADLSSYAKHKDFVGYRALGASGAVSAVMFAMILLMPTGTLAIFGIPMPAFVFGGLYMFYSYYMATQDSNDGIGHDAHLLGGVYGVLFMAVLRPSALWDFFNQIIHWRGFF